VAPLENPAFHGWVVLVMYGWFYGGSPASPAYGSPSVFAKGQKGQSLLTAFGLRPCPFRAERLCLVVRQGNPYGVLCSLDER
jgi:hypothetical protein